MAAEKRLNDIDYCYASWKLLKDLEKNSYSRNECIRNFQEKANARKSFLIGIFALILPLVLWGYLLLSSNARKGVLIIGENFADFGTRLVGLIMVSAFLFLIVFMILKAIWDSHFLRPLRKMTEADLRTSLISDVENIDTEVQKILDHSVFREPRVPEAFLSTEILPLLIRYFENGQVTIMKEAVYALKLELQNTGYYSNLIPSKTLLQREMEYLSDEKGNLEKKIEEGEGI